MYVPDPRAFFPYRIQVVCSFVFIYVWMSARLNGHTIPFSKCKTIHTWGWGLFYFLTNNNNVRFECNSAHIINKRFTYDAFNIEIFIYCAFSYLHLEWYLLSLTIPFKVFQWCLLFIRECSQSMQLKRSEYKNTHTHRTETCFIQFLFEHIMRLMS